MSARHVKIGLPAIDGRHGIAMKDWPVPDQQAWHQSVAGQTRRRRGIHEFRSSPDRQEAPVGRRRRPGAVQVRRVRRPRSTKPWSPERQAQHAATYGIWLAYLREQSALDPAASPAGRITPVMVEGFLDLVAATCAASTVHTYATRLLGIARKMAPEADWDWLREVVCALAPEPPDPTAKLNKVRPPAILLALAEHLMTEADTAPAGRGHGVLQAVQYRDGLMLAILVLAVIRRRSLLSLKHETSFTSTGTGYLMTLTAKDTKAGRPELIPFDAWFIPWIDRYVTVHRKALLRPGQDEAAMWISERGRPLGPTGTWMAISKRTEEFLGVRINPHFIRTCVATWQTIEHPERINELPALLQHKDFRVTERHYALADRLIAGRKYHQALEDERRELEDIDEEPVLLPY
jgi:integrase/recombinase XerD